MAHSYQQQPEASPVATTNKTPSKRSASSTGSARPRGRPRKIPKTDQPEDSIVAASMAPERMQAILAAVNPPDPSRHDISTFKKDNDVPATSLANESNDDNSVQSFLRESLLSRDSHGLQVTSSSFDQSASGQIHQSLSHVSQDSFVDDSIQIGAQHARSDSAAHEANVKQESGQPGASSDGQTCGIDLGSLHFPEENLDVDMYGNLIDCPPMWQPTCPQPPIRLDDGTVFDLSDHVDEISSQIHEALNWQANPAYARKDIAGLNLQQIHERQNFQAKLWQLHCAGVLAKLRITSTYVIARRFLLATTVSDNGEIFAHWDGSWRQSPSTRGGWAFVDRDGSVYDTQDKKMIDMQSIFEQQLGVFGGNFEAMISAGRGSPQDVTDSGGILTGSSLLIRNGTSSGSNGGYQPSEGSSYSQA